MVLIFDKPGFGRRIRRTDATEVATLEAVKLHHNFYSIRESDGYVEPV